MKITLTENKLRSIVEEAIKELIDCPPFLKDTWNFNKGYYVTEGLTCTYNYGKVKSILQRKYDFKTLNVRIGEFDYNRNSTTPLGAVLSGKKKVTDEEGNSTIVPLNTTQDSDNWMKFDITFKSGYRDNADIVNDIIHTCDSCGWFYAGYECYHNGFEFKNSIPTNDENCRLKTFKMYFRAKFNVQYKNTSLPRYLYHICPIYALDKILRQGLKPLSKKRQETHPERVYLYLEKPNDSALEEILDNFRARRPEDYAILRIDTEKINKNIPFYYDSNTYENYPKAVYTENTIDPNAIEVIFKEGYPIGYNQWYYFDKGERIKK